MTDHMPDPTDLTVGGDVELGEPAAPDPTEPAASVPHDSPAPSTSNGASDTDGQSQSTEPVHTFQVTHKVANPENPNSHSLIHSAELSVDEAIAWIRDRLLKS